MNLTKNQIMIIAVLIVAVIAYYVFFRKPTTKTTTKVVKDVKDAKDSAVNAAVVATQAAEVAKDAANQVESAYSYRGVRCRQGQVYDYMLKKCKDAEASYDGLPEQGITQYPYSDALASVSMFGGADVQSSFDGLSSPPTQQELSGIMGTFSTDWLDINK